jgi:hypothetical protein
LAQLLNELLEESGIEEEQNDSPTSENYWVWREAVVG